MSRRGTRIVGDGTIEIAGLRAGAFVMDVRIRADVTRAVATDDISDATDIAQIASTARAAIAAPRRAAGSIAGGVARALLDRFGEATEAYVRVRDATGGTQERTLRR